MVKLSQAGDSLVYSSYLGYSSTFEYGRSIAVDEAGYAHVAFQTGQDVAVARVETDGSDLIWTTTLTGSGLEDAGGIALDSDGKVYVTGFTQSSNFSTSGAYDTSLGGDRDAFLARLNSSGSVDYATYLGGSGLDWGVDLVLNASGQVLLTGKTWSSDFPTTSGAYDTSLSGTADVFVAAMNAAGTSLAWSTLLGGSGDDGAAGIAVDYLDNVYVAGSSTGGLGSPSSYFGMSGNGDAFLARLNPGGTALDWVTYVGGTEVEIAEGLAVDGDGYAVVVGTTGSTDFPTHAAYQSSSGGMDDAFVVRLDLGLSLPGTTVALVDEGEIACELVPGELIETTSGVNGGNPAARSVLEGNVRAHDGAVKVAVTDLESYGFGTPWGHHRTWTNGAGYAARSLTGSGWVVSETPHLVQVDGTDVLAAITGSTNARFFDWNGSSYVPRFFFQEQLSHDDTNDEYELIDTTGARLRFYDFSTSRPYEKRGRLKSYTDPYGNVTQVTSWTTAGAPAEVQRSGGNVTESYLYSYLTSGTNKGLLESITLRRQVSGGGWTTVRQVVNTYYDWGEAHGSPGDLKTVQIKDGSGTALDESYYRYHKPSAANGYLRGLKYAFGPESYARLEAAVSTPLTATDAQVAPYADVYLEFDPYRRVSEMTLQGAGCSACSGGQGTYTFSYSTSSHTPGFNAWSYKTVQTLPDSSTYTVYSNVYGEAMLQVYTSGGQTWRSFSKFDGQGRIILDANPSAVSGHDESKADLLDSVSGNYGYLRDSEGLIQTVTYASTTTATSTTAGNVAGYAQQTSLQPDNSSWGEKISRSYIGVPGSGLVSMSCALPSEPTLKSVRLF